MAKVYIPKLLEGPGILSQIGTEAKKLNGARALIVTDSFLRSTPFFRQLTDSLDMAGIQWKEYSKVRPNPRTTDCEEAAAFAHEQSIDILIGFGGGSSLDQAKAIAALLTNGKTCTNWDNTSLRFPMLPTICVPTTAGTGSEATFVAVITDEKREYKMSLFDPNNLLPSCAICDPLVTLGLPQPLTASCGMDALTHAIEAYTSRASNSVTDALALRAVRLISENILTAYNDGENLPARQAMMTGSTLAGIAFINSNVGAVHAIAETIGARYDIPHGVANALFLPYVMEFNYPSAQKKYADISAAMGLENMNSVHNNLAMEGILYIKQLCKEMNIPALKQLESIQPDDFELIAERSANNPLSLDNAREIRKKDYLQILWHAYHENE